jgi:hypothetical protein
MPICKRPGHTVHSSGGNVTRLFIRAKTPDIVLEDEGDLLERDLEIESREYAYKNRNKRASPTCRVMTGLAVTLLVILFVGLE